jgi:hypothetical protein
MFMEHFKLKKYVHTKVNIEFTISILTKDQKANYLNNFSLFSAKVEFYALI